MYQLRAYVPTAGWALLELAEDDYGIFAPPFKQIELVGASGLIDAVIKHQYTRCEKDFQTRQELIDFLESEIERTVPDLPTDAEARAGLVRVAPMEQLILMVEKIEAKPLPLDPKIVAVLNRIKERNIGAINARVDRILYKNEQATV